jgi:predicted GH43/DUF377 family glycosyl hydrolase
MDLFERLDTKPILMPADVPPSRAGLNVRCVINPGAFVYQRRIGLLLRVCEQPPQEKDWFITAVRDAEQPNGIRVVRFHKDDPAVRPRDPRVFVHNGTAYLTTLSHLRLAWSGDGRHFKVDPTPTFEGQGPYETYGVEDCRVTRLEGTFQLTYTSVSNMAVAVGRASTPDFKQFDRHGLMFPPENKDCAIFPAKCNNEYVAIHRPSGSGFGGHFMWISASPDLQAWGSHRCIATTRTGTWDSERVGVNGPPIATPRGWLVLYHGADRRSHYALGALLLDGEQPWRVLARSVDPIMTPQLEFEKRGFFPNVVFSNGHIVNGDEITIYYGAADEYIGAARGSIGAIMKSLAD